MGLRYPGSIHILELEEDSAKSLNIQKCTSHLGFSLGPPSGRGRRQVRRSPMLLSYCFSRYPGSQVSRKIARLHARLLDE